MDHSKGWVTVEEPPGTLAMEILTREPPLLRGRGKGKRSRRAIELASPRSSPPPPSMPRSTSTPASMPMMMPPSPASYYMGAWSPYPPPPLYSSPYQQPPVQADPGITAAQLSKIIASPARSSPVNSESDAYELVAEFMEWLEQRSSSKAAQIRLAHEAISKDCTDLEGIHHMTPAEWRNMGVPTCLGKRIAGQVKEFMAFRAGKSKRTREQDPEARGHESGNEASNSI